MFGDVQNGALRGRVCASWCGGMRRSQRWLQQLQIHLRRVGHRAQLLEFEWTLPSRRLLEQSHVHDDEHDGPLR
jgi:hypothetical protein